MGREVGFAKIIHGDDPSTIKVKTSVLSGEIRKRIERIAALLSKLDALGCEAASGGAERRVRSPGVVLCKPQLLYVDP